MKIILKVVTRTSFHDDSKIDLNINILNLLKKRRATQMNYLCKEKDKKLAKIEDWTERATFKIKATSLKF